MKAMYCGSFDPLTYGHLNIIRCAARNYDELIVNVGVNPDKKTLLDDKTRVRLIQEAVKELPQGSKIMVLADPRMTVDIAIQHNVDVLIRGIRQGTDDAMQEQNLSEINNSLAKVRGYKLVTEFIQQSDPFLNSVSSTLVKRLCEMRQFIVAAHCVPSNVHQELMRIYLKSWWKQCLDMPNEFLWDSLTEMYDKRAYHNLSHLGYMLNMLQIYTDQTGTYQGEFFKMRELILAIMYHDCVYDIRKDNNESASADFADRLVSCIYPPALVLKDISLPSVSISSIKSLILATSHTQNTLTEMQALICDLDLAILGTFDDEVWKSYNQAIRKEYGIYDDDKFIPARIKVLKGFLSKDRIFHTDFFHNMLETQARKNLGNEIQRLQKEI